MPWISLDNQPADIGVTPKAPEPVDLASPGVGDTFGAAFRLDNTIGSFASNQFRNADLDTMDPMFNPWEAAKGTNMERYPDRIAQTFNQKAFDALQAQIEREEEDRRTLDAAGWLGTLSSVTSGVVDLPSLIPVGRFAQGARLGYDVGKSALSIGAATAGAVAVQEAALQSTQETRSPVQSGIAIGGGAILGAMLGAAGAKLLDNVTWNDLAKRMEKEIYSPEAIPADAAEAEMKALVQDARVPAPETAGASAGSPASAGAAAVDAPSLEGLTVYGRAARAATNATAQLNPLLRALSSPSAETRNILLNLMENPVYLKANYGGQASARAVETIVKAYTGAYSTAVEAMRNDWRAARQAGEKIKWSEYRSRVGRAMRTGDTDAGGSDYVSQSAQYWRERVFDPLKQKAIEAGLLPEDVSIETAQSYFTRLYNVPKIIAREVEFKKIVRDWAVDAAMRQRESAAEAHNARAEKWNSIISDLELSKEDSKKLLASLPEELKALRASNPSFVDTDRAIGDARAKLDRARRASAPMEDINVLGAQIDALKKSAGKDYADYVVQRNLLQSRIRRIRGNIVGRQDLVNELRQRIVDGEAANMDRLAKLHDTLSKLDMRIEGTQIDLAEELSRVRTQFAQILEKSDRAQERLAKAKARREEKMKAEAERGETLTANDLASEAALGDPFVDEARNIARLNELAEEIGRLESIDPEAAVSELRTLVSERMSQTAGLIEAEGRKMAALIEKADKYSPDRVRADVARIRQRIAASEEKLRELTEIPDKEFDAYIDDVVNSIYSKITGRTIDTQGESPFRIVSNARGPLKERTFNISDDKIASFLVDDVEHVGFRYTRSMGADVELSNASRRLGGDGKPDLKSMVAKIRADYEKLRSGVTDEKALLKLAERERADIRDLEAVRDMLRGQYLPVQNASGWAKIVNAAMTFNYIRTMGGVTIASLSDAARPIMVHGLKRWMGSGIKPLVTNLKGFKMAAHEAKLAGVVGERTRNATLATYAELTDPYSVQSPFQRFLDNTARAFSTATLMPMWNDFQKSFASVITQNRILENAAGWGKLVDKERAYMQYLGIDQSMAERILKEFNTYGEMIDGVRAANTEAWTDDIAREAYRAAVAKDVDSIIVTKGIGDVPLFVRTPTGRALMQFKGFALAAHQRAFIRGLQEDQASVVSGLIASTTIGAFIYYLKTVEAGRWDDLSDNPGRFVAEGLDRSGMFPLMFEVNNIAEKIGAPGVYTGLQAIFPNKTQKQPASRYATRSVVDSYLGPTVGGAQDAVGLVGTGISNLRSMLGDDDAKAGLTPSDIAAMRRLMPGASLPWFRAAIDNTVVPWLKETVE